MALFGKKKIENKPESAPKKEAAAQTASSVSHGYRQAGLAHIFVSPRITEKATMHESSGVYTFDISGRANKREIMAAITKIYKVTPRAVRVVTIPSKEKRNARTGKRGVKRGGKKAYVYLKKGDTITLR